MVNNLVGGDNFRTSCKLGKKCIITSLVIFTLLVLSVFLFIRYNTLSQVVQRQSVYITVLEEDNHKLLSDNNERNKNSNIPTSFDDLRTSFKNPFQNIVDELFASFNRKLNSPFPEANVDYNTKKDKYEINIALPGFIKDEISIKLIDDILIIYGRASFSNENEDKIKNNNKTIGNGNTFVRPKNWNNNEVLQSIRIPKDINQEQITTSLANGILTIIIPRNHTINLVKEINIK